MRKLPFLLLFLLILPALTWAQGLNDPALQAAINAANAADPNLERPMRWEFEILLPTTDSALSCPLVPGVQLAETQTPYIVTLYFGGTDDEVPYVVHVAQDGSSAQRCDAKFPNMGMSAVSLLPQATAATPCTVTPSGPFANVRSAPDTEAEQTASIEGERQALGRNTDFTWYLVAEGWVAGTVINNSGDCLSNNLSVRDATIASGLAPSQQPTPVPAGQPTAVAAVPTATPQSDFTCPAGFDGYLPPRIRTGQITAQVEQGGVPNSIRRLPTTESDRIGNIQPGRRLDLVIDGPQCSDGFVWWLVEIDGVRGWTAESSFSSESYFLSPTPGNEVTADGEEIAPPPPQDETSVTNAPMITSDALGSLSAELTLNLGPDPIIGGLRTDNTLVWGLEGTVLSALFPPMDGGSTIDTNPQDTVTSLTTDESGWSYAGWSSGIINAYNEGASITVNAHDAPVNTLAIAPDGALIASGSGSLATEPSTWALRLWEPTILQGAQNPVAFTRSIRFPYPVTDVAFSGDGAYMAVIAQQTTPEPAAAIWVYGEGGLGENVTTLALETDDAGSAFVVGEPDGSQFFYGRGNALQRLDPATGTETVAATLSSETVLREVAINPAGDGVAAIVGDASVMFTTLAQLRGENAATPQAQLPVRATNALFGANGDVLLVQTVDGDLGVYRISTP